MTCYDLVRMCVPSVTAINTSISSFANVTNPNPPSDSASKMSPISPKSGFLQFQKHFKSLRHTHRRKGPYNSISRLHFHVVGETRSNFTLSSSSRRTTASLSAPRTGCAESSGRHRIVISVLRCEHAEKILIGLVPFKTFPPFSITGVAAVSGAWTLDELIAKEEIGALGSAISSVRSVIVIVLK